MAHDEYAQRWEVEIKLARERWPKGPWTDEPDRVEWRYLGLPCLLVRSVTTGAWCGYAGVPLGHMLYGKPLAELEEDLQVHGGVTYSDRCLGPVCHVPQPGETDDVHWIGFDCGHAWDDQPMFHFLHEKFGAAGYPSSPSSLVYRDVAYAKAQVERLAEQLVGMS